MRHVNLTKGIIVRPGHRQGDGDAFALVRRISFKDLGEQIMHSLLDKAACPIDCRVTKLTRHAVGAGASRKYEKHENGRCNSISHGCFPSWGVVTSKVTEQPLKI